MDTELQPTTHDDPGTVPAHARSKPRYRAVFVSDVHLGTKDSQARRLRAFLRSIETDALYLVGDVVDLWSMRRRWTWPQEHNDVIQTVLKMARHGTKVVYVPGNHDEHFRQFVGLSFGGIAIERETIHRTADGRRLLVVHGDEFDALIRMGLLYRAGDAAYGVLLTLNRWMNRVRGWFGLPWWSLAAAIKRKVKNAMRFVGRFEAHLAARAREHGADGVVCGHIHKPDMVVIEGIHYYNDGDWVDSCTALVEHLDGHLEILSPAAPPDDGHEPSPPAPLELLLPVTVRAAHGAWGEPAEATRAP